MDDFGTNCAALGPMASFPVDKLKIDRRFVAGMADNPAAVAILRSISGLGRGLELPIATEGVETQCHIELRVEKHQIKDTLDD
jgi:predicted signal transduction protein with EAL and GGDEF domain